MEELSEIVVVYLWGCRSYVLKCLIEAWWQTHTKFLNSGSFFNLQNSCELTPLRVLLNTYPGQMLIRQIDQNVKHRLDVILGT